MKDKNNLAISFKQFRSPIIHKFKPEIGVSNLSLNKGGVKIKCHKCFDIKYGHNPHQIGCSLLTTLLMVIFSLKRRKLNGESLLQAFLLFVGCVDDVQCVCARVVAIIYSETFVTFHLDSFIISRLITDSDLDQIINFRAYFGGLLGYRTVKMK